MKRFNGIIESEFAPASTMDLWLFKGNLKYFGPKGWTDISSDGGSQSLAQVAYTGDYNDLINLPSIPDTTPITVPAATTTVVGGVKKAAAMTSLSADAELATVTAKLNELIQKLKDAGTLDIPVS
ncbi:hypothetical protein DAC15_36 [Bacteroides phage DAC15]|uniref:head fiber protein n=1 Tax=Bacteroides phage DAC15 TaxID=2710495 RepID=UPI001BECAECA|nr:head fiber protein [Bacteroides phage DAC15]QIN96215.1 hypothetical protein DAC15_36 [Bacteroides phage DAC15]QIN96333.1 hypothetical protein DAC17_34 [Bacteroides phage DAC17]